MEISIIQIPQSSKYWIKKENLGCILEHVWFMQIIQQGKS